MNRKVITIVLVSIIALVGGMILYNNSNINSNQNATIKTDKEAIASRFPKIGKINKCFWKAEVIGNNANSRVPGPSGYWMKGFVEVDDEVLNVFIEKYKMKELEAPLKFDFVPPVFDMKKSKWLYSDEFNEYINPPSFFGKFYIDGINKLIYFDVRK